MSINKIMLAGRLAKDPEFKEIRPGLNACKLTLAVVSVLKGKDGQIQKEVTYVESTVWNKQAELCRDSLKKGNMVTIDGRLKQEKWVDKESGKQRSRLVVAPDQVLFMEPKSALEKEADKISQDSLTGFVDELPF